MAAMCTLPAFQEFGPGEHWQAIVPVEEYITVFAILGG
jgi:hypothetical protein